MCKRSFKYTGCACEEIVFLQKLKCKLFSSINFVKVQKEKASRICSFYLAASTNVHCPEKPICKLLVLNTQMFLLSFLQFYNSLVVPNLALRLDLQLKPDPCLVLPCLRAGHDHSESFRQVEEYHIALDSFLPNCEYWIHRVLK